ncbi:hypothetical protein BJQ94_13365 [Cryobacterium sp. SO2]|nr:hypothetical protein [Cryobacterium sp. SO2]WEO76348.1 hypothetical protein BJQ94_13365 [Cryobacterium sp. SO2]
MSDTGTARRQRMRERARAWLARLPLQMSELGGAALELVFFWR